jgi:UDP-N-acetylmuramoylalanine--D-glutamate ligase
MSETTPAFSLPRLSQRLSAQPICIFGLAREGLSSYHFIRSLLPTHPLYLADDRPSTKLAPTWQELLKHDPQVTLINPEHTGLPSVEVMLIKSPGIPPFHPTWQQLAQIAVEITSNTQLFFEALAEVAPEVKTIGVTGTKGKSTTTALIHHVLQANALPAYLGGNIGVPPLDLLPEIAHHSAGATVFAVLEMSSHQLRELRTSPYIAVIQNIVPEHMDYYASFEEYVEAKSHITLFQTSSDFVIFNQGYQLPCQIAELSPSQQLAFSTPNTPTQTYTSATPVATVTDAAIKYQDETIIALDEIPLSGQHNLENVLPAVIVGKQIGLPAKQIAAAISSFKGLEHRLELVREVNGCRFYNDSLSTVQDAAVAALQAFADQPVILIAGGYDRGLDFSLLAQQILQQPIKALLLFQPTGSKIEAALKQLDAATAQTITIRYPESMKDAVYQAFDLAQPGDVVLMSPASPSFGQFSDYRDRGNQFKAAVEMLE